MAIYCNIIYSATHSSCGTCYLVLNRLKMSMNCKWNECFSCTAYLLRIINRKLCMKREKQRIKRCDLFILECSHNACTLKTNAIGNGIIQTINKGDFSTIPNNKQHIFLLKLKTENMMKTAATK